MPRLLRAALATFLAVSLAAPAGWAEPAKALGNVVFAQGARLGTADAVNGATVFAGDRVSTDATGVIRIRVGGGQIYLLASSAALVDEFSGAVGAELQQGTVGFVAAEAEPLVVHTTGILIRPATAQPTHGQVERVSANEVVVSSFRGSLEVIVGDKTHTVNEGMAARFTLDPEPPSPQGPAGVGAKRARRVEVAMWILGGAAAVGIGIAIWRGNISGEKP